MAENLGEPIVANDEPMNDEFNEADLLEDVANNPQLENLFKSFRAPVNSRPVDIHTEHGREVQRNRDRNKL